MLTKIQIYVQLIEEFRDLPAKFGRQLPSNGLRVHGIAGDPPNGCSRLVPPPTDKETEGYKWVVLIARYFKNLFAPTALFAMEKPCRYVNDVCRKYLSIWFSISTRFSLFRP